ncbi:uncharacterized protein LOC124277142 [Haliotis rubra]|uniref:uncharacterized protein LOC124277142 n=1 Tax=Haliotis rubra TaxID=36100 RepID=UPI001EE5F2F7|nr:uncharacterized protein LOC124277142 [Haliotis rubra]
MKSAGWVGATLLLLCSYSQGYFFQDDYDHQYTYSSMSELFGHKNITTVLKFKIRALNTTGDGGRLHSLRVISIVQFADGRYFSNPKGWNLKTIFLFRTSTKGSIDLVRVHPEDEDELVVIKKAVTSLFSVTVRESGERTDSYETTDLDHLGNLTHKYNVVTTPSGRTLTRSHFSHERAERTHHKTLHYHDDGTLHRGHAYDKILLKEKHVKKEKARALQPGEKVHEISTSGDFPDIWTASTTNIHLDGKSRVNSPLIDKDVQGLAQDTLEIKMRKVHKRIHDVQQNISHYLQCVHMYPAKGDANRTQCVQELREILQALHPEDYKEFVNSVLNVSCGAAESNCSVERLVFIDIVARIADEISQELIVKHVLNRTDPNEEELRHVFIHCIAIAKPIMQVVRAVEGYCFGVGDQHHGSINLTVVQTRACLAVGSLARNLHLYSNSSDAVRLVEKIESWITKHEMHPHYRHKRSVRIEKDSHYIISKKILLHSLGNAGHPQSLNRIISLTSPGHGHHDWRRAAVEALRHYRCNQSAGALLESALRDAKQSVRRAARYLYLKHPRANNLTHEQQNIILSHSYAWPVIARMRRSVLDAVLFQFRLALPHVDWKKEIGNSAIGASFGVLFENEMSAVFRPLSGFVDIDIHDKLWAEAHISIVGIHIDILLIELCYKGRLEYNANKFKDISVGLVQNIAGAFDDMAKEIMKPMTDETTRMTSQFLEPDGKTTKSNFEPLAKAVKDLPVKTDAALSSVLELNTLTQQFQSMPWVTRLQQAVDHAQALVEGINTDALNFYKKISDGSIVALPVGEKEIMDSVNTASSLMGKIAKFPKQAFSHLEKAKLGFQLGMGRIFSANSVIRKATSLLKGQSSSWMSTGSEITHVISSVKSILSSGFKRHRRRKRTPSPFDQVNDLLDKVGDSSDEIYRKVETQTNQVISHLESLRDKEPQAFQEGLGHQKLTTETIQKNFQLFQEAIEKIKSTIQSLFGSKFHPSFPGQRRPSDSSCGKGTYPSDTRSKYGTAGIDLVLNKGWKVINPVAGIVRKTGASEVTIKPTDSDFKQYEIIIANINPSVGDEDKHFEQAQVIGTSGGNNGCDWPHIHLAVKKKSQGPGDDLCFYMDPSPFVDTLKLKPVWHQECKDFTFKHIGQVADLISMPNVLSEVIGKLKREALDWLKGYSVKLLNKIIPPDSELGKAMSFISSKLGSLSDVTQLFTGLGGHMNNFLSTIKANVKGKAFGAFSGMLMANDRLKSRFPKLSRLIGNATSLLKKVPIGNLKTFATGGLGKHLGRFGILPKGGRLASTSLLKTSMFKMCENFKTGFLFGHDQMCTANEDCLGFSCHIDIPLSRIKGGISLKVRVHPLEAKVDVELNGEGKIAPKGNSVSRTGVRLGPVSFSLQSSVEIQRGGLVVSLSVKPCYRSMCLHDIKIIKHLAFHHRHKRDISATIQNGITSLENMDLSSITDQLTNLNIPGKEFVGQMNEMLDGIRTKITEAKADPVGALTEEMKAEDDYEDKQDYPNGKPLYFPFFPPGAMTFPYPAGPVVFVISLDAGAELGQEISVDVQTVKSTMSTSIGPFVAGKVKASFGISIIIASAGISLTGWLMKTSFPFVLEMNYAKVPTVATKKLNVELTPLELRLRAWVKILFIINMHFDIWHWRSPTYTGTMWEHQYDINDNTPPRFPNCDHRKRSLSGSCSVRQLDGRHPSDTAFILEVDSGDENSPLTLHYSIGTSRGGRDVKSLVEMRGPSLTLPTVSLPHGVPLYWTIRARNTQGIEATAMCMLHTYDNTVPDGRVDAAYQFTSHRTVIQANVVVFEDSPLTPNHSVAVGYSPGEFGKEILDWQILYLENTNERKGVMSELKMFAPSKPGKLSSAPFSTAHADNDIECARLCLQTGSKCISFDYEMHTQSCDLQETVVGAKAKLRAAASYFHYERLGVGYSAFREFSHSNLEHGAQYFINAKITNTLGYVAYLPSTGTLADFTPPEPGPVGEAASDVLTADGCKAAVTQRCIDVTKELNHRKIIDGSAGRTVFGGNKPLDDTKYTLANNYISGNCDGFHDDESGIWGYTWAAGTSVCGSDVVKFTDPHAQLQTRQDWTYTGLGKNLHLADGQYYITFQAINNVVHGGALVTTVCHSTPVTVDTTQPVVHEVGDLLFDEDFDILGVYFNVSDSGSGIARVDFGLGKTKYDVFVRSYSRHPFLNRADPYLVIEDLGLTPGVQAWVRIRAVNSVDLSTASHGDVPILIDFTPPVVGKVLDGDKLLEDVEYQHNTQMICAQWVDFYDPESGIDSYLWGVGTTAGADDILPFTNFTHQVKSWCNVTTLHHNTTYYSTVVAFNGAINQKEIQATSNGVLVDITPPLLGFVQDGPDIVNDVEFSSQTATIESAWANFTDPESHVQEYTMMVYVNDELKKKFHIGSMTSYTDHTIDTKHKDHVRVQVTATNGAGLETQADSNGYMVDETPPNMMYIQDSQTGKYQSDSSHLGVKWYFTDEESGILEYRYTIFEKIGGQKKKFWPKDETFAVIEVEKADIQLDSLPLTNGAQYTTSVTALNNALLATSVESSGVVIDTTPPTVKKVLIGLPGQEEELDDFGNVIHMEDQPMHVSWTARDPESGISQNLLCVKNNVIQCTRSEQFTNYGSTSSVTLEALNLISDDKTQYVVVIRVTNGAGLTAEASSKPIHVEKGNSPGTVYDGRSISEDTDFQQDLSSLSMSFDGFGSDACGITGYDWAIGTQPYLSDIMHYTNYGLTMVSDSSGYAEITNTNFNNVKYYVTVRAITGVECPDSYIVSSSNGVTVDHEVPVINQQYRGQMMSSSLLFLNQTTTLPISWSVEDANIMPVISWSIGSLPVSGEKHTVNISKSGLDPWDISLSANNTYFVTTYGSDMAGNKALMSSPPITVDETPVSIIDYECTPFVSMMSTIVTCSWRFFEEAESTITNVTITARTGQGSSHILVVSRLSAIERRWSFDTEGVLQDGVSFLYITLEIENGAHLRSKFFKEIVFDQTPPADGELSVVTSSNPSSKEEVVCQQQTTYMSVFVNRFNDPESQIDRYEAGLGSERGLTDVLPFTKVTLSNGLFVVPNLHLESGALIFVTVRIFNKAGLFAVKESNPLAISPKPYLLVWDGPGSDDVDSQHDLTTIQGRWGYSDPCPVISAEWAVEDITGEIIKGFEQTPGNGHNFYNDELTLENMKTYRVIVRTTDALNRTMIGRSDGVMVKIQPPVPGNVRDGIASDINYQLPTNYLAANWDPFGEMNDLDPSQKIEYYEVAVGNDRRYKDRRSNVHFFENVGLNRSYVFKHLNLTAKTVTYYITVRAYSSAGSYEESFSNGIRAGFGTDIVLGDIEVAEYQSSSSEIQVSWSDFISDFNIRKYEVAVDTEEYTESNTSLECHAIVFQPLVAFESVNKDTIKTIKGLQLNHSEVYFVLVKAEDEAGMCLIASSKAITIDTTPPQPGQVIIDGGRSSGILYATQLHSVHINMTGFTDEESSIDYYTVALLGGLFCTDSMSLSPKDKDVLRSVTVSTSDAHFNDLMLDTTRPYYIQVTAANKAGLKTTVTSEPILADYNPPVAGNIKIGSDWRYSSRSWGDTNLLQGTILINTNIHDSTCKTERELLNNNYKKEIVILDDVFQSHAVDIVDNNRVKIYARLDPSLQLFEKGGVKTNPTLLTEGNYSFSLQATARHNVSSMIGLIQESLPNPDDILKAYAKIFIDNCNGSACSNGDRTVVTDDESWNLGVLLTMNNISEPLILFWAKDKSRIKVHNVHVDFDPSFSLNDFSLQAINDSTPSTASWDINLFINGQLKGQHAGLNIQGYVVASVFSWNNDGYIPQVDDPFDPFTTNLLLSSLRLPLPQIHPCRYGRAFYDSQSGIKDISIGLSDSQNTTANVVPYTKQMSFCVPCKDLCKESCGFEGSCSKSTDQQGLSVRHFQLSNLTLIPSRMTDRINYTDSQASAYYFDVKVTDHAGYEKQIKSNAIIIDTTPPVVTDVTCFDPEYSLYEPALYIGNDHAVSAKWEISEDFSDINAVFVGIGTKCGLDDIVQIPLQNRLKNVTLNSTKESLQQDQKYFVGVTVINSAGLNHTACCPFVIDIKSPTVSSTEPVPLFVSAEDVAGLNVSLTEYNDRVGIQWDDPHSDVDYFDWQLASEDSADEIYPTMRVGSNTTRRVEVLKGDISLSHGAVNASVSEFLNRNFSDGLKSADFKNSPLMLEPGKCVIQTVTSVSRAHKRKDLTSQKTCIKRKKDMIVKQGTNKTLVIDGVVISESLAKNNHSVCTISVEVSSGALAVGVLSKTDQHMAYGAPAAVDYSPYIVSPDITSTQLSRFLTGRVYSFVSPAFYLSPISNVQLTEDINVDLPASPADEHQESAIILWDSGDKVWRHVSEICGIVPFKSNATTRDPHAIQICNLVFKRSLTKSNTRAKRATLPFSSPRMFSGAIVSKHVNNTPPIIDTSVIQCVEDSFVEQVIKYHDLQHDNLTFTLEEHPHHGEANLTAEGMLSYRPEKDFNGYDSILVNATEVFIHDLGIQPATFTKRIHINVSNVNDPPVTFYQRDTQSPIPSFVESIHKVYVEGNLTDHSLGSFWVADVDDPEDLTIIQKDVSGLAANFTFKQVDAAGEDGETYRNMSMIYSGNTITKHDLKLKTLKEFHGSIQFSLLTVDTNKSYSHALSIHVFVLINPCYHGSCAPRTPSLPCEHPDRASSFQAYHCECVAGYEGQFCEKEINECLKATCSLLYDCEDKLATYECVLNIPKILAILVCILLPCLGVTFYISRKYKHIRHQSKVWNLPDNTPDTQTNPVYLARCTSTTEEVKEETTSGSAFSKQEVIKDETPAAFQENGRSTPALFMGPGHARMPHRKTNYFTQWSSDKTLPRVVD